MVTVGFVTHGGRPEAPKLEHDTSAWLRDLGHSARTLSAPSLDPPSGEAELVIPASRLEDVDLAVSLGGDGTMLRTVDLVSQAGIPVLGVNVGHLGYLTTVEPADLCSALLRYLNGDYQVEGRMTLDIGVRDPSTGTERLRRSALNDIVLARPKSVHTVHAAMSVAGTPFLSFAADSLIIASPTGSTAYNLSARGPIASPRTRVQIVTSVAAHMLFDRSLVLAADEEIEFEVTDFPAELQVDGPSVGMVQPGEVLHCVGGARDALLVSFGDREFHTRLKQKFNLADR